MWMLVAFFVYPWADMVPARALMETPDWLQCNYMHQIALQAQSQFPGDTNVLLNCVWVEADEADEAGFTVKQSVAE